MKHNSDDEKPVIVLVDGENAPGWALAPIMTHVREEFGVPIIRRVYGDWNRPEMKPWAPLARAEGFEQVQQLRYASGKDVIDMRMAIDAVDLAHDYRDRWTDQRPVFCLVTSDSDFIPLIHRLQRDRLSVIVFAEEKAMKSLTTAANQFVPLSEFAEFEPKLAATEGKGASSRGDLLTLLQTAFRVAKGEHEHRIHLGRFGQVVKDLDPEFEPRQYGQAKFIDLVRQFDDHFEVDKERDSEPPVYYVSEINR